MKSPRRTVCAILLTLYSVTNGAGTAWVICCGADGHVSFEPSGSACCAENSPDAASVAWCAATNDLLGNSSDCGACTDIPLFGATPAHLAAPKAKAYAASTVALALLPANTLRTSELSARDRTNLAWVPMRPDGRLTCLRTVFLRC